MSLLSEITADSPTSLYLVDETSGTVADDNVTTNDGTYVGSPTLGATGLVPDGGTAVTFPGSATHTELTLPAGTAIGTNGAIELVFKWSSGTALMRDHTNAGGTGWIIGFDNAGTFAVRIAGGTTINTSKTTASVRNGNRHILLVSKTGAQVDIYLDGVNIGSSSSASNTSSASPWHVGRNGTNTANTDYPAATVDYVAIFPAALSSTRAAAHAAALTAQLALGATSAQSSATLALTAATAIALGAASAQSSATMDLTAPSSIIPLDPSSGASSDSLSLAAPIQVPLDPSSGAGSDSLTIAAPTQVPLAASSGASSATAAVGFPAPVTVPLDPASGQSSATADIAAGAPTPIPLDPASGQSVASLVLAASLVFTASGQSSAALALQAPTRVLLAPSSGQSNALFTAYSPLLVFPLGFDANVEFGIPDVGAPPPEPRTEGTVDDVGALAIARRSFLEAQRRLPQVPVRTVLLAGRIGWFADDAETGAVAIAGVDGPLAPYAGSVVRIIYRKRSIYAYVMRANGTPEDLDLSRRAFLALAYPSDQIIHAVIEVVG